MDSDPCLVRMWTGNVQLPRCLTIVPLLWNILHQFYFILKPGIIAKFISLIYRQRRGVRRNLPIALPGLS